jgi:hypothetical protein
VRTELEDKMKKAGIFSIALLMSVSMPLAAWTADFDGSKPLLCSVISVIECTPSENHTVSAESIGMPQFIMVDAARMKVWPAMNKDGKQASEIKRVERIAGNLVLHGVDEGIDKKREAVSWTGTISEETGKFVLTASGDQVAFVVFGACLPQ